MLKLMLSSEDLANSVHIATGAVEVNAFLHKCGNPIPHTTTIPRRLGRRAGDGWGGCRSPVIGLLELLASQRPILARSYEWPSHADTGSRMTSREIGHCSIPDPYLAHRTLHNKDTYLAYRTLHNRTLCI